MKAGVLALQGDVEEHLKMLADCGAEPVRVRDAAAARQVDALIIPGGESTTIGKLMDESGISKVVKTRVASEQFPVWGTCAGMILMAKKGDGQVEKTGQKLLGLMDIEVNRNAFGRQRESFEAEIELNAEVNSDGGKRNFMFPAVFIRAPIITKVYGEAKVLAKLDGKIVAAEQGNLLATAFHPELSGNKKLHEYFLNKIGH